MNIRLSLKENFNDKKNKEHVALMVILSAFFIGEIMDVQHVFWVGAKSLGAYGGYETFVYKLTEYHQNNKNIKYHVACKANGDGCMDESKLDGVTKINDHEFEFHNAHCFKIDVPQIGPAQAIYYDVAALNACCNYIKKNHITHPIVYIMACRIGPFNLYAIVCHPYL